MNRRLIGDYIESIRRPEFWVYATWLEIVTKYRRSRLGMFWALLPSALYTFGIGWFFNAMQGALDRTFYAHIGIGYVLFRLVTASLNDATTTCSSHLPFIMDGRVRLTDYTLRVIARALFHTIVAVPVLSVAIIIAGAPDLIDIIRAVLGFGVVLVNLAWMATLVAILGARITDVHQLIGSILMFSFLFTPIIWRAEYMPLGTLQGTIARINPLFHFVEIVRSPLTNVSIELTTYAYLVLATALGWSVTAIVYRRYAKYVPMWL